MRLLLDTHVWLWWHMRPEKLSGEASTHIQNPDNHVFLSSVSSWEIAIKIAAGKLELPEPLEVMVAASMQHDGFQPLPVQHSHCFEYERLPKHHRDPFDRMLIAQARTDQLTVISADQVFAPYGVSLIAI